MKIKIWVLFVLVSLFVLPVMGQQQQSGLIKVTGTSKGKYLPDMIRISLEIRTEAVTQKEAVNNADIQFEKMINKLITAGIDPKDIRIIRNFFGKQYECDEKTPALYFASKEIEINLIYDKTKFLKISDSLSTFNLPDLNFYYTFTFSDLYKEKIKKELIEKATDNAFQIAQIISKHRNLILGDVALIEYNISNYNTYNDDSEDFYIRNSNYNGSSNNVDTKFTTELSYREIELFERVIVHIRVNN